MILTEFFEEFIFEKNQSIKDVKLWRRTLIKAKIISWEVFSNFA